MLNPSISIGSDKVERHKNETKLLTGPKTSMWSSVQDESTQVFEVNFVSLLYQINGKSKIHPKTEKNILIWFDNLY